MKVHLSDTGYTRVYFSMIRGSVKASQLLYKYEISAHLKTLELGMKYLLKASNKSSREFTNNEG